MAEQEDEKIKLSKKQLAETMAEIDLCVMTTVGEDGQLYGRPMSNNTNVEWDGDTWFFAYADSSQVQETKREPNLNLAYARPDEILFITLTGRGEIVTDVEKKKELWYDELERWFPNGPEDENVVLIKVNGQRAYYWSKEGDAELEL